MLKDDKKYTPKQAYLHKNQTKIIMKSTIIILLMCAAQLAIAQSSLVEVEENIEKQYTKENVGELIDLVSMLPTEVPIADMKSDEWLVARRKCVELYLNWYQKMFVNGFKLDNKISELVSESAIAKLETDNQKEFARARNIKYRQKNKSISSFLIAEQRLRLFVKNSFKGKKKQMFEQLLLEFDKVYDPISEEIMNKVLAKSFGFTIYENKILKE